LPELLLKSLIVGAAANSDRSTLLQLLVVSCTLRLQSGGDLQRPEGGAAAITSTTSPAARHSRTPATVIAHTQAKERLTQLKDPTR
jgi:hypothetical protein